MSYLGRGLEQVDNISKLDNITFNGGTTYALTKDSAAFTPISSNAILISIDGVVQQGNFSVSGTNIVFNFSPTSSNTCDFIMHYGTGVAFTPADNSITKDKTNFVSTSSSAGLEIKGDGTTDGYIQLNCSQGSHGIKLKSPNHASSSSYTLTFPATDPAANKMLQTDGSGNLSFVDAPSGGLVYVGGGSTTSNVSAITIDNVFTSTYENYMVIGDMTSNGNSNPVFNFRSTAPATITNSNYKYSFDGCTQAGNAATNSQSANSEFEFATQLYNSNQIDFPSCWFQFFINSPNSSTHNTTFTGNYGAWKENGNLEGYAGAGMMTLQTACGGMRFATSANSVNNANIKVYGIVNS